MSQSPIPDQIIARRKENGLSQVGAAKMIPNVSVSTWRAWEYGQNPMHPGLWELFTLKLVLMSTKSDVAVERPERLRKKRPTKECEMDIDWQS